MSSLEFPQCQAFVIVWQASKVRVMANDEAAANVVPSGLDGLFLLCHTERGWQSASRDQPKCTSCAKNFLLLFFFWLVAWIHNKVW